MPLHWIRELKGLVTARGAIFVHAPVIGSVSQVESGALHVLMGCDSTISIELSDSFRAFCSHIHLADSPEQAALLKLSINGWLAAQIVSACEVISVAETYGLSRRNTAELLAQMPISGSAMSAMLLLIAKDDTASRFPIRLMTKDFDYLLAACNSSEGPSVVALCRKLFSQALESGRGEQNVTAIIDSFH